LNTSIIDASKSEANKYGIPLSASANEYGFPNACPTVAPKLRVEVVDKTPQLILLTIHLAVAILSEGLGLGLEANAIVTSSKLSATTSAMARITL
jgi:hypothetical protein